MSGRTRLWTEVQAVGIIPKKIRKIHPLPPPAGEAVLTSFCYHDDNSITPELQNCRTAELQNLFFLFNPDNQFLSDIHLVTGKMVPRPDVFKGNIIHHGNFMGEFPGLHNMDDLRFARRYFRPGPPVDYNQREER